jgi:hypothetical protein
MNLEKLKEKYIIAAKAQGEASCDGNSRIANREYSKLAKIYHEVIQNKEDASSFLFDLLQFSDPYVQIWAAAHLLGMNLHVDSALRVLQQIADMNMKGMEIVSFDAQMTIKQWKANGHLQI